MSSCFSRCLRVPIAIRAFYESYLWILQTLLLTHPDLHPGVLSAKPVSSRSRHPLSFCTPLRETEHRYLVWLLQASLDEFQQQRVSACRQGFR